MRAGTVPVAYTQRTGHACRRTAGRTWRVACRESTHLR